MEPAGLVHRGEYVFSGAATAALGVDNLEAMHRAATAGRGYSAGGFVDGGQGGGPVYRPPRREGGGSAPPQIVREQTVIHNYSDTEVREEREDDGRGGTRHNIYIEKMVASALSRPGSAADKELRGRGAQSMMPLR